MKGFEKMNKVRKAIVTNLFFVAGRFTSIANKNRITIQASGFKM